jgi:hypothetical protein
MLTYVYRYVTDSGEIKYVERRFRMSERPDNITVEDTGTTYTAVHVIQAPGIQGMINRESHKNNPSDLPPANWAGN